MFAFKTGICFNLYTVYNTCSSMANIAEHNEQLDFVASPLGLRCFHVSHLCLPGGHGSIVYVQRMWYMYMQPRGLANCAGFQ